MSLFEEAAKAWAEPDKEKGALPIEQDVARAYIDGRNAGRASERSRLREKVEALRPDDADGRSTPYLNGYVECQRASLALLAEPGESDS